MQEAVTVLNLVLTNSRVCRTQFGSKEDYKTIFFSLLTAVGECTLNTRSTSGHCHEGVCLRLGFGRAFCVCFVSENSGLCHKLLL